MINVWEGYHDVSEVLVHWIFWSRVGWSSLMNQPDWGQWVICRSVSVSHLWPKRWFCWQGCVLKQGRVSILCCAVFIILWDSWNFSGFLGSLTLVEELFFWAIKGRQIWLELGCPSCELVRRSQGKETRVGFAVWRRLLCGTKGETFFTSFVFVAGISGAVWSAWCAVIRFHDFSCAVIMH